MYVCFLIGRGGADTATDVCLVKLVTDFLTWENPFLISECIICRKLVTHTYMGAQLRTFRARNDIIKGIDAIFETGKLPA